MLKNMQISLFFEKKLYDYSIVLAIKMAKNKIT